MTISWQDFEKVDMRVGVVTDAKEFPEARRPAIRLWIDFGPLGTKRSSAQITAACSIATTAKSSNGAARRNATM